MALCWGVNMLNVVAPLIYLKCFFLYFNRILDLSFFSALYGVGWVGVGVGGFRVPTLTGGGPTAKMTTGQ